MNKSTHFVGRTEDGSRVFLSLRLSATAHELQSVTHETINAGAVTFTAQGFVIDYRRRDASSSGQCLDALLDVTNPAPGWTLEDLATAHRIWSRWHLNDMRAACAHMPGDAHQRWDRRERVECAAGSGYTYGRAWLVEKLPASVVADIERLQALPVGAVPNTY